MGLSAAIRATSYHLRAALLMASHMMG